MAVVDKAAGNEKGEMRKYGTLTDLGASLGLGGLPKPNMVKGFISTVVTTNSAISTANQFIDSSDQNEIDNSNPNNSDNKVVEFDLELKMNDFEQSQDNTNNITPVLNPDIDLKKTK